MCMCFVSLQSMTKILKKGRENISLNFADGCGYLCTKTKTICSQDQKKIYITKNKTITGNMNFNRKPNFAS